MYIFKNIPVSMLVLPIYVVMIALSMGSSASAYPTSSPPVGRMVSLSPAADFEPGSTVLTETAEKQLDLIMSRFKMVNADSILVTGFSNAAQSCENEALAFSRALAVKAFFTLRGINPDHVSVKADESFGNRPGQVLFEITGQR